MNLHNDRYDIDSRLRNIKNPTLWENKTLLRCSFYYLQLMRCNFILFVYYQMLFCLILLFSLQFQQFIAKYGTFQIKKSRTKSWLCYSGHIKNKQGDYCLSTGETIQKSTLFQTHFEFQSKPVTKFFIIINAIIPTHWRQQYSSAIKNI